MSSGSIRPARETEKLKERQDRRFATNRWRTHDWVLHLSREGHKEGMLRSYKFESRRILMQDVR